MKPGTARSFGARLKELRESAGFTQEELATIAGLSVHAVSALERGERRRPHAETARALCAALDLAGATRDAFLKLARAPQDAAVDELSDSALPGALTALLGREADLQTLQQWLSDPSARLITLTGPGGAGKTRLALEIGHAIAGEGATRVVFVPLAAIANPALVASAIAEALSLSEVASVDLPKRVRVACADHPTLLVLDNFEQLIDAASLVAELLASVPALRALVTSRAPLRVRGEREYAVGPLALDTGAASMSPADLGRSPAVRLFVERARDVRPGFRLTPENGPAVTAICRRLDGLPLALELAAPWLRVLTVDDLLRRLTDDVLFTIQGPRDLPERQQTINATVAWSHRLLSAAEQRAFRRLSALPGRFSIEAAAAVIAGDGESSADALAAVAGLIDKSLVLRADGVTDVRPLYRMLETVRAYAAAALGAAGEREEAMDGLARYCAHEASIAGVALVGPSQIEWLGRVRDDLENYRAALAWLIDRGRPAASHILWDLMAFWLMRGHLVEGLEWYERSLTIPSPPPAAESRSLVGAALMWYTQGSLERAAAALERALTISRHSGDTDVFVTADNLLGHIDHATGNLTSARARHLRSLESFRARELPWGVGNALGGLAAVALAAGEVQDANDLLVEATSALRLAGPWFLTPVMYLRAVLAVQRGDADEAMSLLRESLTHIRELQDKFSFVYAMVALAAAAVLKGDDTWGARALGAGDAVTERTGATVVDKSVQEIRNETERGIRARLGADRWSRAYLAGRSESIEALMKDIDGAS